MFPGLRLVQHPRHLQPPPRRRHKLAPASPSPSSALLAVLSALVASSTGADGRPLTSDPTPPPFLCPSLQARHRSDSLHDHLLDETGQPAPTTYAPSQVPSSPYTVPDQYVEGPDGRWRKVSPCTYVGSHSCQPRNSTDPSTTSTNEPSSTPTAARTDSSSATIDMDTLPLGWKPFTRDEVLQAPDIVIIALVLAFFITLILAGSIIWRRKMKASIQRDLERKKAFVDDEASIDEDLVDAERAKSRKKVWAKATATWKAHARYTVRRRRGKRSLVAPSLKDQRPSIEIIVHPSSTHPSRPSSPASSRRSRSLSRSRTVSVSSSSSHVSLPSTDSASPSRHTQEPEQNPALESDQPTDTLLPPAYQNGPSTASTSTTEKLSYPHVEHQPHSLEVPHPNHQSNVTHDDADLSIEEPGPSYSTGRVAHVATDDKAVLASLASMSSAPPSEEYSSVEGPHTNSDDPHVPTWHDEVLEDFQHEELDNSVVAASSSLLFPPPPMQATTSISDTLFFKYSYPVDPDSDLAMSAGPSAPPFSNIETLMAPSAPLLDEEPLSASAPPLSEDEEEAVEDEDEDTCDNCLRDEDSIPCRSAPPSSSSGPSNEGSQTCAVVPPLYQP